MLASTSAPFKHRTVKKPNLALTETKRITVWFALCRERLSLGPYSLEAGTLVLASTHRMGRDPALFPDPLAVKPERWLRTAEMTARKENTSQIISFYRGGSKICIH
jgi:cytochrome P450